MEKLTNRRYIDASEEAIMFRLIRPPV